MNRCVAQPSTAIEKFELNHEGCADDGRPLFCRQFQARSDGAAGGQQVVDQQYTVAWLDCVAVDFQSVGAVFQIVV